MTQQSFTLDGACLGKTALDAIARRHARAHGLTFVRVEMERGLFQPVEVAVFRRSDGGIVRRTAEMIEQAR